VGRVFYGTDEQRLPPQINQSMAFKNKRRRVDVAASKRLMLADGGSVGFEAVFKAGGVMLS